MRLVGGNRERGRMIGQPVADFWPAGNRKALAEMIVAAANHAERDRASTRQLASDGILREPVLRVWTSGSGEQNGRALVCIPVTNAQRVRSLLLDKQHKQQ